MQWCGPVGDPNSRVFPSGNWRISLHYLVEYLLSGNFTYHTGIDINLPGTQDVDQPIRAVTDGVVVYASYLSGSTWLGLVVIRHEWEGHVLYSRYGHMRPPVVKKGQPVTAGQQIGVCSPTAGTVAKFEPHLHFDLSALDDPLLERSPTNWPGANQQFIEAHYQNPVPFLKARLAGDAGGEIPPVGLQLKQCKVITSVNLSLREWPDADSAKLASIPPGSMVTVAPIIKSSEDGYTWTYAWVGGVNGWLATADKTGQPWLEGFQ